MENANGATGAFLLAFAFVHLWWLWLIILVVFWLVRRRRRRVERSTNMTLATSLNLLPLEAGEKAYRCDYGHQRARER